MSGLDLDGLRKAYEAATPGEWFALWRDNHNTAFEFVGIPTKGNILLGCEADTIAGVEVVKGSAVQVRAHADVRFIAAAHNAFPALLAEAERARRLEEALRRVERHRKPCANAVEMEPWEWDEVAAVLEQLSYEQGRAADAAMAKEAK